MPTLLTLTFTFFSLFSLLGDAPGPSPETSLEAEEKECVYVMGIPIYCK